MGSTAGGRFTCSATGGASPLSIKETRQRQRKETQVLSVSTSIPGCTSDCGDAVFQGRGTAHPAGGCHWGPRRNPAKRFRWGEETQRNGRNLSDRAGRGMWSLCRRRTGSLHSRICRKRRQRSRLPASALFFFTAPAAVFLFGMTKRKMGAGFLSGKAADCCDMPLEGECLRSENDDMESGKT